MPSAISHDVYMHCSYDIAENKHWVKKALNQVIRRHLLQGGWTDRDVTKLGERNGKPVMIVLLEHFPFIPFNLSYTFHFNDCCT